MSFKPIARWLSKEVIAAKRERRRLMRRWLATHSDSDELMYRRACRTVSELTNDSRRGYYDDTQPPDRIGDLAGRQKAIRSPFDVDRLRYDNITTCMLYLFIYQPSHSTHHI